MSLQKSPAVSSSLPLVTVRGVTGPDVSSATGAPAWRRPGRRCSLPAWTRIHFWHKPPCVPGTPVLTRSLRGSSRQTAPAGVLAPVLCRDWGCRRRPRGRRPWSPHRSLISGDPNAGRVGAGGFSPRSRVCKHAWARPASGFARCRPHGPVARGHVSKLSQSFRRARARAAPPRALCHRRRPANQDPRLADTQPLTSPLTRSRLSSGWSSDRPAVTPRLLPGRQQQAGRRRCTVTAFPALTRGNRNASVLFLRLNATCWARRAYACLQPGMFLLPSSSQALVTPKSLSPRKAVPAPRRGRR